MTLTQRDERVPHSLSIKDIFINSHLLRLLKIAEDVDIDAFTLIVLISISLAPLGSTGNLDFSVYCYWVVDVTFCFGKVAKKLNFDN